ncbi:MAG: hypothetical protein WC750_02070 [Patescibacteria group bacterium]|jgi:hypothetical protein
MKNPEQNLYYIAVVMAVLSFIMLGMSALITHTVWLPGILIFMGQSLTAIWLKPTRPKTQEASAFLSGTSPTYQDEHQPPGLAEARDAWTENEKDE